VLSIILSLLWLPQAVPPPVPPAAQAIYVPERVYDTRRQVFADLESMIADIAKADVVFVGEQHDDPNTHRLEAAMLDGLRRRGVPLTLSLEMFERDTQAGVDSYLAGTIAEEEFLKTSRPWPRYATDYRSLVELAKGQGWPVIASNVPRRYASSVAKSGLSTLDGLPPAERALIAVDLQCPRGLYFDRFAETMNGHQGPAGEKLSPEELRNTTERYYLSQCVKDETMAEAIAAGFERGGRKLVVHVNGAFHSDFGLGTAERVRRRLGERRVAVVSVLPVKDLDTLTPAGDDLKRADYLLYTVAEPKK
jgi:uncharacterized iron-regulated protein